MSDSKEKRVFCDIPEATARAFQVACLRNGTKMQAVLSRFVNDYLDDFGKPGINERVWTAIQDVRVRALLQAAYRILVSGSSRDRAMLETMVRMLATREGGDD